MSVSRRIEIIDRYGYYVVRCYIGNVMRFSSQIESVADVRSMLIEILMEWKDDNKQNAIID
jgi:hypothetical protein